MRTTRRQVLFTVATTGLTATCGPAAHALAAGASTRARRLRFVHVDVFTSTPLLGNPLDVFLDARGLTESEMLAITRETYLSEATFVFPRDPATERERGVSVRIYTPDGEVPFAGHPTLGTASVLRALRLASIAPGSRAAASLDEISLDLKVGKVPVTFRTDAAGQSFGEMRQVAPKFGAVHDKETVARLHHLSVDDIADDGPIQTVSTGLPFAIVPLKRLDALQSLRIDAEKMNSYTATQEATFGFYYLTRDTAASRVDLRTRCVYVGGEDAATGSAAGCTAAWLVRHGVAAPEQSIHIKQGVEMKRASDIFVRASRDADQIVNVRVGGYTVQTMEGELIL